VHIKLRITDILCALCWTYSSTGFALLGLNEILFLPCAAAKAKSCGVCSVFEFFKIRTLSLPPPVAGTNVFNFLWITVAVVDARRRVCAYLLSDARKSSVLHFERAFTRLQFRVVKQLVRRTSKGLLKCSFYNFTQCLSWSNNFCYNSFRSFEKNDFFNMFL